MKNFKFFCAITTSLLFSTSVYAITVTGNATAVIKKRLAATEIQTMDFGTITSETTAGTVTLSTAGVASSPTLSLYGTTKAGIFTVTGEPSTAITVNVANSTLTSGANNMAINSFTHSSSPASDTTDINGNLTLNIGATLIVGANQNSGTYSGTYNITLSY